MVSQSTAIVGEPVYQPLLGSTEVIPLNDGPSPFKGPSKYEQSISAEYPGPASDAQDGTTYRKGFLRAQIICFSLHGFLIAIYLTLLGVHIKRWEHHVKIPSILQSNNVQSAISTTVSTFNTLYSAALLYYTHRLAVYRQITSKQTLTATHDFGASWTGLYAAFRSYWRQRSTHQSGPVFRTFCVALYLFGISVLHITSASLITLLYDYNSTIPDYGRSYEVIQPLTKQLVENYPWNEVSTILPIIGGPFDGLSHPGLVNNVLYNSPELYGDMQEARVPAVDFIVSCGSLSQIGCTENDDGTSTCVADTGNYTWKFVIDDSIYSANVDNILAIPSNNISVTGSSEQSTSTPLGRNVIFYSVPCIRDSQDQTPSSCVSLPLNTSSDETAASNSNLYAQFTGCTLSYTNTKVSINFTSWTPQVTFTPFQFTQTWATWDANETTAYDPVVDWWTYLYNPNNVSSGANPNATPDNSYSSDVEQYLAQQLGFNQNNTALSVDGKLVFADITLEQLEGVLANMSASILWAGYLYNPSSSANLQTCDHRCYHWDSDIYLTRLMLNLNMLQVCFSLVTVIVITILAKSLVWESKTINHSCAIEDVGVLDLLWLFSKRPDLTKCMDRVSKPTAENLRAAGQEVEVCLADHY